MATLSYRGRSPDRDAVIVPKSYADTIEATEALTTTWVNNQIAATTPLLTVQSYVDTQDALLAHQADVTTADSNYVAAAARSATNGVAALDSLGNLLSAQLPSGILTDRVAKAYSMMPLVAFEAIGTPGFAWQTSGSPTTVNGAHNSAGGTTTVVLCYVSTLPNGSSVTGVNATVTYGGVAMTEQGLPVRGVFPGNAAAYGAVFYLFNPPSGSKTVAVTLSATGVAANGWFTTVQTVSYTNVGSLGTLAVQSDFTGSSATETLSNVACPSGGLVSVGFTASSGTGAGIISNFNQTTRYNNTTASQGLYFLIGDSNVASTITFSATLGAAEGWGALGVPLNPGGSTTQIGALNFSGSWTATGSAVQKLASIVVPDPGYPWRPIPMAWVRGDSSGSTRPANRSVGTGSYGLLTVVPPSGGQVYGVGACTGSFFTGTHPVLPYGAPGQTPLSVPALNGSVELDLLGQLWSGTTFTFYSANLVYSILVFPAI